MESDLLTEIIPRSLMSIVLFQGEVTYFMMRCIQGRRTESYTVKAFLLEEDKKKIRRLSSIDCYHYGAIERTTSPIMYLCPKTQLQVGGCSNKYITLYFETSNVFVNPSWERDLDGWTSLLQTSITTSE